MKKARRKLCRSFITSVLVLVMTINCSEARAVWLAWLGVGFTVGAVVVAATATGPGAGPATVGLATLEIFAAGADILVNLLGKPNAQGAQPNVGIVYGDPYQEPSFAGGTDSAPSYSGVGAMALISATYKHMALQGDDSDAYYTAINSLIDQMNKCTADYWAGDSNQIIYNDLDALANAFDNVANAYDTYINAYGDFTLTQSQMTTSNQSISQNGLPAVEVTMLQNAGVSNSNITDYTNYVANVPITLKGTSVNASTMFHSAGSTLRSGLPAGM